VANLERATKAVAKEQSELEIGRRRLDAGRMLGNVINQRQGLGDALTQIATPQLVLHISRIGRGGNGIRKVSGTFRN
jgi:hypothetical protein